MTRRATSANIQTSVLDLMQRAIVLVDSVLAQISSEVPDGLTLLPLGEALTRHGDSLKEWLDRS